MTSATAVRTVSAPPERVWAVLTDHEGMPRWAPGLKVALTRRGTDDPNGVGAVRRLGIGFAGPIVEEIVTFEPTHRFGYRALAGIPLKNYRGEVVLRPDGPGTEIRYTVSVDELLPFGEPQLVKGIAHGLLSGLLRGVRSAG